MSKYTRCKLVLSLLACTAPINVLAQSVPVPPSNRAVQDAEFINNVVDSVGSAWHLGSEATEEIAKKTNNQDMLTNGRALGSLGVGIGMTSSGIKIARCVHGPCENDQLIDTANEMAGTVEGLTNIAGSKAAQRTVAPLVPAFSGLSTAEKYEVARQKGDQTGMWQYGFEGAAKGTACIAGTIGGGGAAGCSRGVQITESSIDILNKTTETGMDLYFDHKDAILMREAEERQARINRERRSGHLKFLREQHSTDAFAEAQYAIQYSPTTSLDTIDSNSSESTTNSSPTMEVMGALLTGITMAAPTFLQNQTNTITPSFSNNDSIQEQSSSEKRAITSEGFGLENNYCHDDLASKYKERYSCDYHSYDMNILP